MIKSCNDPDLIKVEFFIKTIAGIEQIKTFYLNKDVRADDLMFIIPNNVSDVHLSYKKKFKALEFVKCPDANTVMKEIKKILNAVFDGCEKEDKGEQRRITSYHSEEAHMSKQYITGQSNTLMSVRIFSMAFATTPTFSEHEADLCNHMKSALKEFLKERNLPCWSVGASVEPDYFSHLRI